MSILSNPSAALRAVRTVSSGRYQSGGSTSSGSTSTMPGTGPGSGGSTGGGTDGGGGDGGGGGGSSGEPACTNGATKTQECFPIGPDGKPDTTRACTCHYKCEDGVFVFDYVDNCTDVDGGMALEDIALW
jgi:hypothetical protein